MMIYVTLWEINIDPENHQFLEETNLPTPMTTRVELLIYWRLNLFSHWIVFLRENLKRKAMVKFTIKLIGLGFLVNIFPSSKELIHQDMH